MSRQFLTWLGQSSFLLGTQETTIACDLYLSDYCKKRSKLDHTRKMMIPVSPEKLDPINHYLITHAHIDHFDPETVGPILLSQPQAKFYCPPDCRRVIEEFFKVYESRFNLICSGKEYALTDSIRLLPLPAAHEELTKDEDGEDITMSYLLLFDKIRKAVFFAGDTIPFDGQDELIRKATPENFELTLVLPVNGRDAKRAALGFKGNLTLDEAINLYRQTNGHRLVPCHFGMFELNDIQIPLEQKYFLNKQCNAVIPIINSQFEL